MVDRVTPELIERQKDNEAALIDQGVGLYRIALMKSREKGCAADTMPGRWLSANFLEPVAVKIRGFLHDAIKAGKTGQWRCGSNMLTQMNPDVYAYIAIRAIFNALLTDKGRCERLTIQSRIAREIRDEMQHSFMEEEKSKTYQYWMKEVNRAPEGRTRVRIMKRLKRNFPGLPTFNSEDENTNLAAACAFLVQVVVEVTGIATIEKRMRKYGGTLREISTLVINPAFLKTLDKMHARAESLWPKFEPMICPPRPWTGAYKGGFIGALGERTQIIRVGRRSYLEEIHNSIQGGGLKQVVTALNAIQDTPWRINKKVYTAMRSAFDDCPQGFGMPSREALELPTPPPGIKNDEKLKKSFAEQAKAIQMLEAKRASKHAAVHAMLRTADRVEDEEAIWFPHNLDWRGRVYPLASYLSPQGDELNRALLEFARGLPLETDEAVDWLAIHGANCYGIDKVPFEERIQWVRNHEEQIRASAADPLGYTWWSEKGVDKPWMFLAWCYDWVGYLENGKKHVSHLPVAMDGSCNGLQNFAAMLRHEETARAVNLVPSEKPADIYQMVADKVSARVKALAESESWTTEDVLPLLEEKTRREYADSDHIERLKRAIRKKVKAGDMTAKEGRAAVKAIKPSVTGEEREETLHCWNVIAARWIAPHITRKLVKRPVMTYPYAVTQFGIKEQLIETLREMDGDGDTAYPVKHAGKIGGMLRGIVYDAVQETVVAAAEAMRWLRSVAEVVAKGNMPVTWVSPVGLPVVQCYWESTKARVVLHNGGQKYHTSVYSSKEGCVKASKQAAGVAPNFVHSCDAAHLMLTVLACGERGLSDFHMIHDSYGTHARNAGTLALCLREEFIDMYGNNDVLSDLLAQLKAQCTKNEQAKRVKELTEPPKKGNLDLTSVLTSRYFFA